MRIALIIRRVGGRVCAAQPAVRSLSNYSEPLSGSTALISTTAVRAQSMCTLARVDLSCEGCGEAQAGGHEAAGGVEAGEKSTVDVLTAGTGLGT